MELKSDDGALLKLSPACDQSLTSLAGTSPDPEERWLLLRGTVTMNDSRSWSFEDPCINVREARQLSEWLRKIVAKRVKPSAVVLPDGLLAVYSPHGLSFTEPNLAFSLEEYKAHRIRLRVHFSIELCPPWLNRFAQPNFDFFIVLQVEDKQLLLAAAQWEAELVQFNGNS